MQVFLSDAFWSINLQLKTKLAPVTPVLYEVSNKEFLVDFFTERAHYEHWRKSTVAS
jgi:hypothetical protein